LPSAKSYRVSERRRARMLPLRSQARTVVRRARRLVAEGDMEAAEAAVKEATAVLDKAAQKGALHKGNASRRKSRLMRSLTAAQGR
jgi:small subunit ribosomal protein S20